MKFIDLGSGFKGNGYRVGRGSARGLFVLRVFFFLGFGCSFRECIVFFSFGEGKGSVG